MLKKSLFLCLDFPSGVRVSIRVNRHQTYIVYLPEDIISEYQLSSNNINDISSEIYTSIKTRAFSVQLSSITVLGN